MGQSNLGDFGADVPNAEDTSYTLESEIKPQQMALRRAPEGAEPFDDLSCPWCLGSKDDFKTRSNGGERVVSCGHCDTVIPTTADWYLRGEKISYP